VYYVDILNVNIFNINFNLLMVVSIC